MAWNRPSEEKVKVRGEGEEGNFHLKGFLAGVIVVVGAALAAWWLLPTGESAGETPPLQAKQRIKEASPLKRESASRPQAEQPKDPPGYYNGKPISDSNRPPWMSPNHRIMTYKNIRYLPMPKKTLIEETFEHGTDQMIAELASVEPGTLFVGDCKGLFDNFAEDFKASLTEPIIVSHEDSEDVKALKRAVNALRLDLKDRMDAGENIQEVMEETWKSMRDLGLYKEELVEQLNKISEDHVLSETEVDDYISAANKMLEERGSAPLRDTAFLKQQLLIQSRNSAEDSEEKGGEDDE